MNITWLPGYSYGANIFLNGKDVSRMTDNDLAEVRNKEIGFVFQQFNLLPRLNCCGKRGIALIYSGIAKKERTERALKCLTKLNLKTEATINQMN